MRRPFVSFLGTMAVSALSIAPAFAAACEKVAAPPAALAGWATAPTRAEAAANAKSPLFMLKPGLPTALSLHPMAEVKYPHSPERSAEPGNFGGFVIFAAEEAGIYRVALGDAAWIDVIGNGATLTATTYGHGPDCTGIRKTVDFALQPGTHILQLVGSAKAEVKAMVAKLP